jgi:hypothetical protein
MKNIKKIAEDIFKAPTHEELIDRLPYGTKDEVIAEIEKYCRYHLLKPSFVVEAKLTFEKLFPHGAYRAHDSAAFEHSNILKSVKRWKKIVEDSNVGAELHVGKISENKNIARIDYFGLKRYYFEK